MINLYFAFWFKFKNVFFLYYMYTFDHYRRIVKYKTSYYTFCLPVGLAMILGGVENSCWENTREILLKFEEYFQVHDDYLDCFGDPKETGKVETDIMKSKCTYLAAF